MTIRNLLIGLICSFAAMPLLAHADNLDIREWLVPWPKSEPRDVHVDQNGRVWFVGLGGDFIANLNPADGQFNRYDVQRRSRPSSILIDDKRTIWFTASGSGQIGALSPSTGQIVDIPMPLRKAKDPSSMAFDNDGNIWFTVQNSNFIGLLDTADRSVELVEVPVRKARPYAIVVDRNNMPWATASEKNLLLQIFPATKTMTAIELPNKKSRPRQLVAAANGDIWYVDSALGRLGRYRPLQNEFREWQMPGGEDSQPYAVTIDRDDRVWVVETGLSPNRLVGFDTRSEVFLNTANIPSGGGSIKTLFYYEPRGEIWFGGESNYVGRAIVH